MGFNLYGTEISGDRPCGNLSTVVWYWGRDMSVGYQANIMLNTDAKPKFHRRRPIPYFLHTKVDAELERMQREGILKPVERSEWAAPIVVAWKGGG